MPIRKRHQYINEKASSGKLAIGDTIKCYSKRELNSTMLYLSSEGYGVAIIGYANYFDNRITITAVPKEG